MYTPSIKPLQLQPSKEPQIRDLNNNPPNQPRHRRDIHKPLEHRRSPAIPQHHIRQRHQGTGQSHGQVRRPEPVAFLEETGCVAVAAEAVEGPRGDEDTPRCAAYGRGTHHAVDYVWEDGDAGAVEGEDEGGLLRSSCFVVEGLVVGSAGAVSGTFI